MRVAAVLAALATAAPLAAQRPDRGRVAAAIDSIAADALGRRQVAGMAVAVIRGRDTLVLAGYGRADLEFDVPMPVDAVFEIGSLTKQFTAAAILQLADAGRLSLDDDLTRHLPDYPLQGHHVTIRRLLDHTSGIASYTDIPEFAEFEPRTLPRDSLVRVFAAKPFDFAPGERMAYNNSGYFLLGLIIEKVSGQTYADYVRQHLFEPSGMATARYCDERAVVPHRAHGYDVGPQGFQRAAFLVHAWPFAAGSLCAGVGDLVVWNSALHGGRILSPAAYRELLSPGSLNDGTRLRYAKGVEVDSLLGRRAVHHGGDINGFASELQWFPDDEVTIAVLVNSQGPLRPQAVARAIGRALFGVRDAPAPFRGRAEEYAGDYADAGAFTVKVRADSARVGLTMSAGPLPSTALRPAGGEVFDAETPFGNMRLTFLRTGGRVTALRFDPVVMNRVLVRSDAPQ